MALLALPETTIVDALFRNHFCHVAETPERL